MLGERSMSKVEAYTCEICGRKRTEVNHWWMAIATGAALTLRPWDDDLAAHIAMKHLCGATHRDLFIARWAAELKGSA
jgi:hypothetical protein